MAIRPQHIQCKNKYNNNNNRRFSIRQTSQSIDWSEIPEFDMRAENKRTVVMLILAIKMLK